MNNVIAETGGIDFYEVDPETLEPVLSGDWKIGRTLPSSEVVQSLLESKPVRRLTGGKKRREPGVRFAAWALRG